MERLLEVIEKLSWNVEINGKEYTFQKYTPAGLDFHMYVEVQTITDLIEGIHDRYESYDPSEEAYLWLDSEGHGVNGAPYEMGDVYTDMVACKEMIFELYSKITAKVREIDEEIESNYSVMISKSREALIREIQKAYEEIQEVSEGMRIDVLIYSDGYIESTAPMTESSMAKDVLTGEAFVVTSIRESCEESLEWINIMIDQAIELAKMREA